MGSEGRRTWNIARDTFSSSPRPGWIRVFHERQAKANWQGRTSAGEHSDSCHSRVYQALLRFFLGTSNLDTVLSGKTRCVAGGVHSRVPLEHKEYDGLCFFFRAIGFYTLFCYFFF